MQKTAGGLKRVKARSGWVGGVALVGLCGVACSAEGGPADGQPALFGGCESSECEVERALSAWPSDPEGVVAALEAHPVIEARVAVVHALLEVHPQETGVLCGVLPQGRSRMRCQQVSSRPHLWAPPRPETHHSARPGGGPSSNVLMPSVAMPTTLREVAPLSSNRCSADTEDPTGCLVAAAQIWAQRGQPQRVAGLCMNIASERWQSECFFQAAEVAIRSQEAASYGMAVDLCAAAGPFVQSCYGHTLMAMAGLAPAATDTSPGAWAPFLQGAEAVAQVWQARDAYMAEVALDRLWSEGLALSYGEVSLVTGDPLAEVPAAAHRHVRAAAAQALLSSGQPTTDLAGWVARLEEALARRITTPQPARRRTLLRSTVELWPTDLPGEELRPATAYLGTARRTHAPDDPAVDAALCVLEAAARIPELSEALLAEGARHADERVRWTAARLQERRPPL